MYSLAVTVGIQLIRVRYFRAIIDAILYAVSVSVHVIVARIADQIVIGVQLFYAYYNEREKRVENRCISSAKQTRVSQSY